MEKTSDEESLVGCWRPLIGAGNAPCTPNVLLVLQYQSPMDAKAVVAVENRTIRWRWITVGSTMLKVSGGFGRRDCEDCESDCRQKTLMPIETLCRSLL